MVKKIIVVDDHRAIAELVVHLLEFEGFVPELCTDSLQALPQIQEFGPHLVILDLMMPNIDGFTILEQLRQDPNTAKTKVILCTSFGEVVESRKKDLQRLSASVLHKPFDIEELLRLVYKLIGEP